MATNFALNEIMLEIPCCSSGPFRPPRQLGPLLPPRHGLHRPPDAGGVRAHRGRDGQVEERHINPDQEHLGHVLRIAGEAKKHLNFFK